jgi:hypothetical protein
MSPEPHDRRYAARTMMPRSSTLLLFLVLTGCQLPSENPPEAPKPKPAFVEAGALPPEETPPPETEPAPASAQPVEPGIAPTGAPTRGKLPKPVIDEKLKSAGVAVQACYEKGLKAKPDLRGSVNVNFVVGEDGKVAHADATDAEDALPDASTVDCILGAIKSLEFPQPSGGRVFISYPLKLEPAAGGYFTRGGIGTWHSLGGLSHFSRLSQKCSTCCPSTSAHSLS